MSNITLRTHLIGSVTDFCVDSGLPFVQPELLVDLIVRLARYQEEGVKLSPQVYLTDNMDSLVNMLPDGEKLQLGITTAEIAGITEMLKACAPIATGHWRVFGHKRADMMSFGVFRGSGSPIAVGVDDVLLEGRTDAPIVKVHQVADECVQIRNSKGGHRYVFFNHKKEDGPSPLRHVEELILSITRRVAEGDRDTVQSYLGRIVSAALSAGHGCIWVVTSMPRPPQVLRKDGIFFDEPIDFQRMIRRLKAGDLSLDFLDRKAELVKGMLCSDGISLFDEQARLLAARGESRRSGLAAARSSFVH